MSIVIPLLYVIEVVVCLLLAGVVMLQKPKEGGLGGLAGGMGEAVFGADAGNVLIKATIWLGSIFLVNTLILARLTSTVHSGSLMANEKVPAPVQQQKAAFPQVPAPATPAPAAKPAVPAPAAAKPASAAPAPAAKPAAPAAAKPASAAPAPAAKPAVPAPAPAAKPAAAPTKPAAPVPTAK